MSRSSHFHLVSSSECEYPVRGHKIGFVEINKRGCFLGIRRKVKFFPNKNGSKNNLVYSCVPKLRIIWPRFSCNVFVVNESPICGIYLFMRM